MPDLIIPAPRELTVEKFGAGVRLSTRGRWVEPFEGGVPQAAQFFGAVVPAGGRIELAVVSPRRRMPLLFPVSAYQAELHHHVAEGDRLLARLLRGGPLDAWLYGVDELDHHHSLTVKASGSTAMTLSTDVSLTTIADIGAYVFHCDSNPLAAEDEILILITKTKILTGSTARISDRYVIATGLDAILNKEDKPRVSRSFTAGLEYLLRQEGGTARTIDWSVDQLE